MPLLKNDEWILDTWRFYPDDQPIPTAKPKIVTLARLQGDDGEFLFHCGCRLGVRLESFEKIEDLEPWLGRLQLVALVFPKLADGRAFSPAAVIDDLVAGLETGDRWAFRQGQGGLVTSLYGTRVMSELVREFLDGERGAAETARLLQERIEDLR